MPPPPSSPQLSLPQPRQHLTFSKTYQYVCCDDVESTFFGSSPLLLENDTLCWILQSKGQQSRLNDSQRTKLFERARVVAKDDDNEGPTTALSSSTQEQRVKIRYTKGSTYRVKRSHLVPVLERPQYSHIVIVASETCDYRRACVVHTCVHESFLEIGCDFGVTVDRVQTALTTLGEPKRNTEEEQATVNSASEASVQDSPCRCLGIDKSPESIAIAKSRFPHCEFRLEDALTEQGMKQLCGECRTILGLETAPSVIAIDINGNRELPAVLQCLENVLSWSMWRNEKIDEEEYPLKKEPSTPRLVIVKSRQLYAKLKASRST